MLVTDILAVILVQAEAANRGWLAGAMDTLGWYFGIATTTISVQALSEGSTAQKVEVLVFVGGANLLGTKLGQVTRPADPRPQTAARLALEAGDVGDVGAARGPLRGGDAFLAPHPAVASASPAILPRMTRGPELLRMTIYGQPAGAGSKVAEPLGKRGQEVRDRDGRLVLKYRPSSKFTKPWMEEVEKQARIAWQGRAPLDGAIWVELHFFEERPKAHYRAAGLKPTAPAHPAVTETHDRGKMTRAIEDALTNAGIWVDDKRVVASVEFKHYCDEEAQVLEGESWREPRALIRVGRMAEQTVEEAGISSPAPEGQASLLAA